ncbi:MAG: hypothetical protein Kow00121_68840 [Elainellaceae cyanobacterium]
MLTLLPSLKKRTDKSAQANGWFQREGDRVSCPFEQVWSKTLAQEIVRELRNQS